jgi:hypothetical protein
LAPDEALARLLGGGDSSQPGRIGRMFAKLTDAHSGRMAALGLARPERRGAASDAAARPFRTIRSRAKGRRPQGELGGLAGGDLLADDRGDAVAAHGDPVQGVGGLHGPPLMGDHDELRAFP